MNFRIFSQAGRFPNNRHLAVMLLVCLVALAVVLQGARPQVDAAGRTTELPCQTVKIERHTNSVVLNIEQPRGNTQYRLVAADGQVVAQTPTPVSTDQVVFDGVVWPDGQIMVLQQGFSYESRSTNVEMMQPCAVVFAAGVKPSRMTVTEPLVVSNSGPIVREKFEIMNARGGHEGWFAVLEWPSSGQMMTMAIV